jgi:hypothetical protein
METTMKCVRCPEGTVTVVAHAPDGSGAWEIYRCERCNYAWRSTEPPNITDPALRDPFFQLSGRDLDELSSPLPLP